MSHLVEPCVHLRDCTWDCGRGDVLMGRFAWRPVAQYRGQTGPAVIQGITLHTSAGDIELNWQGRGTKDPDLLVFSDQVFHNLVYDGVYRRQGRFVAEEVARSLREKPALGGSGAD